MESVSKLRKTIKSHIEWQKATLGELTDLRQQLDQGVNAAELVKKKLASQIVSKKYDLSSVDAVELSQMIDSTVDALLDQLGSLLYLLKAIPEDANQREVAANNYAREIRAGIRKTLQSLNDVVSRASRILAFLETPSLPRRVTHNPTFKTDNKLPSPDDEDSPWHGERFKIVAAENLADKLDFTDKEMASVLTISIRTYHRLKPDGILGLAASERLAWLSEVAQFGLEVFEDQTNFNKWLRLPLHALDDQSPLEQLSSIHGILLTKTILGRIEYGVYS